MIEIKLCNKRGDVDAIIRMAEKHPAPEYDCSFTDYSYALRSLFQLEHVRMWIAEDDDRPVGYIIAIKDISGLLNQITIFDLFVRKSRRGGKLLKLLTDEVKVWCREQKVKRAIWTSRHASKAWARTLGLKVSEHLTLIWEVE